VQTVQLSRDLRRKPVLPKGARQGGGSASPPLSELLTAISPPWRRAASWGHRSRLLRAGERLPPEVGDRQPQHAERPEPATADGVKDTRNGRSPYFWTVLSHPAERISRLLEALFSTARIILRKRSRNTFCRTVQRSRRDRPPRPPAGCRSRHPRPSLAPGTHVPRTRPADTDGGSSPMAGGGRSRAINSNCSVAALFSDQNQSARRLAAVDHHALRSTSSVTDKPARIGVGQVDQAPRKSPVGIPTST
jgi:hypothetical protein